MKSVHLFSILLLTPWGSGCLLLSAEEQALRHDPDGDGVDAAYDCDDRDSEVGALHYDADGDGFGREESTLIACVPTEYYILDGTDCDDGAVGGAVYPGAPEICGDGVVNDCDATQEGTAEDCALSKNANAAEGGLALSQAPGMQEIEGAKQLDFVATAGLGTSLAAVGNLVLGGDLPDLLMGAPGSDQVVVAGWTSSPFGEDDTVTPTLDTVILSGAQGTSAGAAVVGLGALCGEGTMGFAVGAPQDPSDSNRSTTSVGYLSTEGSLSGAAALSTLDGASLSAGAAEAEFGSALASDGTILVVGSPGAAQAQVYRLTDTCDDLGTTGHRTTLTPEYGVAAGAFGASLAVGDTTGSDGVPEVFVGAPEANDGAGAVWFYEGPNDGDCWNKGWSCSTGPEREALCIDGDPLDCPVGTTQGAGASLALVDLDGDGDLDLLVGAPAPDGGTGAVLPMISAGDGPPAYDAQGPAPRTGASDDDRFGAALATADGDALGALGGDAGLVLVGAPGYGDGFGAVYGWMDGWPIGGVTALDADFVLVGEDIAGAAGSALAVMGDLDGDPLGLPEIAVGAPGGAGKVWIIPLAAW